MNDISFFSNSRYLFLPTKKDPKVMLAIDSTEVASNSFKLYNPFSKKAQFLKQVFYFISKYFHPFVLKYTVSYDNSEFITFLENKLDQNIISSIYNATAKDKVVLQLQSKNASVLGYVKYPLNEAGEQHLLNEKKAIEILSSIELLDNYLLFESFNRKPFLFLKELKGDIGTVEDKNVYKIVEKFKRNEKFFLCDHPRILQIESYLLEFNMTEYMKILQKCKSKSSLEYSLCYEHGDFAPWNIVKVEDSYIPFDFEYFEENGLEYFDLIKYFYQVGRLLEAKEGEELISYVVAKIEIEEAYLLFQIFLLKEIMRMHKENEIFDFEIKILDLMEKK